jgi:hypothetical protein
MGLLASEALARAAGFQEDHHGPAPGGPVAKSLAASVAKAGEYSLPPLPYAYDALDPSIDPKAMRLHHDKHHSASVKGANEPLAKLAETLSSTLSHTDQGDIDTARTSYIISAHF